MIRYKTLFYILMATTPFINLSLITGLKFPLPYIALIVIFLVLIFSERSLPVKFFGYEDLFFISFLVISIISTLVHQLNNQSFTQIINYIITYLFFKVSLLLLIRSEIDVQTTLRNIYNYNTWLQIFALIPFFVGFYDACFHEKVIAIFNNSQNFSIGAISSVYPTARLFGFSPEPSFWSFFVAVNIALVLIIDRPGKVFFIINLTSLFLTFGRTGILICCCMVLLRFLKGNALQQVIGVTVVFIGFYMLKDYLDVDKLVAVDDSFRQRIGSLVEAAKLIDDNVWLGLGLGNFKIYAIEHQLDFLDVFNLFLSIQILTGIFSLLCFLLCLYCIYKRISPDYNYPFFAAVIGWMTVNSYNLPYLWLIFAVLVYATIQQQHSNETENVL